MTTVLAPPKPRQVTAYTMLPPDDLLTTPVVVEGLVTRLKYWDGSIQEGIQYQGDLYKCVKTYSIAERLEAFSESQDYATAGQRVCITVSKQSYTLWVGLRSLAL